MATYNREPFQVYLRDDQVEALQILAQRRGISIAELIREGVDALLTKRPSAAELRIGETREDDPLRDIIGLFDSGAPNLGLDHDKYIAQLVEAENGIWPAKSS
ncbi:MAG TPA: ribbon-helix-helix domain-containing protein [Chloroflexia bacterium]|nr:ribbon-helix-helix domain-containing protein [Chloroflexia bacterium]